MTGEIGISKKTRMWQRLFVCLMFSPFQPWYFYHHATWYYKLFKRFVISHSRWFRRFLASSWIQEAEFFLWKNLHDNFLFTHARMLLLQKIMWFVIREVASYLIMTTICQTLQLLPILHWPLKPSLTAEYSHSCTHLIYWDNLFLQRTLTIKLGMCPLLTIQAWLLYMNRICF